MFGTVFFSSSLVISIQNEAEYPFSELALAVITKGFSDFNDISVGAFVKQSADLICISSRYVQAFELVSLGS